MAVRTQRAINTGSTRTKASPPGTDRDTWLVESTDPAAAALTSARAAAVEHDRNDLLLRLDDAAARMTTPRCRVVIIGQYNAGKSSLVNALLNARVCPTDADISTAVPTWVQWGPSPSARPVLTSDAMSPAVALDPAGAEDAARGLAGPDVRGLSIELPRDLLASGVLLVDTPGVGGGLAAAHATVALRALAGADMVLFTADASREYNTAELDLLVEAARLGPRVVCVLTKVDQYADWRRIADADRLHLARRGLPVTLIPVSSPLRHRGLRDGDDSLVIESGFPVLTTELLTAVDLAADSARASAVAVAQSVLGQLRSSVASERAALAGGVPDPTQVRELEIAVGRAEELRGVGARWQQLLAERMDDLHAEMEVDLTMRLRSLGKAAGEQVRSIRPGQLAAELPPWLQRQVNEAMIAHARLLHDQADALADAVAEQFGTAAWELRAGVDLEPARLDGSAARAVVFGLSTDTRQTKFELGLATVRGGATGAMVTHAIALVAGIAVPVVLPFALVLSPFLAAKSWQSARYGQLRMLRGEAERSVGLYLQEVDVVARKQTRDALRRTRRHLRDIFTSRAAELHTTALRTAEALASAATAVGADRARRGEELDAELEALATGSARCAAVLDQLLPEPSRRGR